MPSTPRLHKSLLIPEPQRLTLNKGSYDLGQQPIAIMIEGKHPELLDSARDFQDYLVQYRQTSSRIISTFEKDLQGIHLSIAKTKNEYELSITANKISIVSSTAQGIFYGLQTLKQIINICGAQIPQLHINDNPHFELRGFYYDITRSKTPKLKTLKDIVQKMSFYKLNHLQLYVEHTFAFRHFPEIWADKDPLTAEEILELDAYAAKYHIELVPSLSTFGHLYELMRTTKYQHLNELEVDGSTIPFSLRDRMRHYTLDVSQKESFQVVQQLLTEYIPLFRSNKFNICCDETFDLGKGKNQKKTQKYGESKLYVDFLKKIIKEVKKHNLTPMFWGDIVLHDPKSIQQLPKNLIYLNWAYGAKPPEQDAKIFHQHQVTQVLCPGVSGWNHYLNNFSHATKNIGTMANYARQYQALGILNTDWGDYGHVNLLASSFHGMTYGAACSWSKENPQEHTFDRAFDIHQWQKKDSDISKILRRTSHYKNVFSIRDCYIWIQSSIELDAQNQAIKALKAKDILQSLQTLREDYKKLKQINLQASLQQDIQEILWGVQMNIWSHELVLLKKKHEFSQPNIPMIHLEVTITKGYALVEEYIRLWRERNKESQLCHTRDTLIAVLQKMQRWVSQKG